MIRNNIYSVTLTTENGSDLQESFANVPTVRELQDALSEATALVAMPAEGGDQEDKELQASVLEKLGDVRELADVLKPYHIEQAVAKGTSPISIAGSQVGVLDVKIITVAFRPNFRPVEPAKPAEAASIDVCGFGDAAFNGGIGPRALGGNGV